MINNIIVTERSLCQSHEKRERSVILQCEHLAHLACDTTLPGDGSPGFENRQGLHLRRAKSPGRRFMLFRSQLT